ncbi:MAG: hypothetical protein QOD25_2198 [Alphaproteobacteria bacterium]|jgi:uncharacterized protein (DUF4415 family)|nr:hypothetical protein [Alphaproteobacteria bacterium]
MSRTDLTSPERDQLTKLATLPDEEIDVQDIPEAPAENWRHALRGVVRVDRDVLKWFEEHAGRDYPAEINRVLRLHVTQNK